MDFEIERTRISEVRENIPQLIPDDIEGRRVIKGFVVSRHFIPSTASRSLTMFKLLKNSKLHFTVFSQHVFNNKWLYGKESKLYSKNIDQNISTDEYGWDEYVVNSFIRMNNIKKFDFLLTCVMPPFDHKIGSIIKERLPGILWAALWSDPVAYSPYANTAGDFENPAEIKKKEYEKQIFKEADILIFTNKYQMEYMLAEDYDHYIHKCIVVHHGFDLEYYPENTLAADDERIVCGYIGHMDEYRTVYELAEGVLGSKYKEKFRIKLIGHVPEIQRDFLMENGLGDIFEYMGELSWEDCLIEMKRCDFLITMDPDYKNMDYSQQMSSKIADYLGSFRPILFMSFPKGISADIARETGNKLIGNNKAEISKVLDDIAIFGVWKPDYDNYMNYSAKNTSAVLDDEVFRKLNLKK